MRIEGYNRWEIWKRNLSLGGNKLLDRRSSTKHLQYINTFDSWGNVSSSWLQTNTRQIHERDKQTWLLEYSVDPCDRGLKLGHRYLIYNVDLCHIDVDLSIAATIQMWIHARYTKLHHNLGKAMSGKQIHRVFISSSTKYDFIHVITMI